MEMFFTIYSTKDYCERVDDDCIHDVDLVRGMVVVQHKELDDQQVLAQVGQYVLDKVWDMECEPAKKT